MKFLITRAKYSKEILLIHSLDTISRDSNAFQFSNFSVVFLTFLFISVVDVAFFQSFAYCADHPHIQDLSSISSGRDITLPNSNSIVEATSSSQHQLNPAPTPDDARMDRILDNTREIYYIQQETLERQRGQTNIISEFQQEIQQQIQQLANQANTTRFLAIATLIFSTISLLKRS